ncbi:MAG: 50S ribosomal protein L21 [Elainellaceae cyanobacterium]
MAYAIVSTSGTQLRVEPGRFYDVNRIVAEADEAIALDQVLFIENDGDAMIGQPLVEGAVIEATVMQHLRGRKIIVYKMQPKKKTRKKRGHRQELTRIMVNSIKVNGTVIAEDDEASATLAPADEAPMVEAEQETEAPESTEAE